MYDACMHDLYKELKVSDGDYTCSNKRSTIFRICYLVLQFSNKIISFLKKISELEHDINKGITHAEEYALIVKELTSNSLIRSICNISIIARWSFRPPTSM